MQKRQHLKVLSRNLIFTQSSGQADKTKSAATNVKDSTNSPLFGAISSAIPRTERVKELNQSVSPAMLHQSIMDQMIRPPTQESVKEDHRKCEPALQDGFS